MQPTLVPRTWLCRELCNLLIVGGVLDPDHTKDACVPTHCRPPRPPTARPACVLARSPCGPICSAVPADQ